ncbi:MAG: ferric reductase-like transmembrane domain-containing protein [Phycisphaerae bacterium]|nr:ferric reductase-like transmembrane domain-containing protein [Phycisphaerae bacterium]
MSTGYVAVQWSRQKRVYDASIAIGIALYLGAFVGVSKVLWQGAHGISDEVILIRALGSCAIVLLHVILCIGPLARLDPRFLPILYNRRHLGVITFLVALAHAMLAIGYYHGFGVLSPVRSLLTSNPNFDSLRAFPFELLGLGALAIMFLMAATSHDFWLRNLSASTWKRLHMLVYVAYGLLVCHVALGALQTDRGWIGPALMFGGLCTVSGLHIAAGLQEYRKDRGNPTSTPAAEEAAWVDVGAPNEIPIDRARTVCAPGGERIAVFSTGGTISAITNICAHQGGPIGEGKVIDGCITCPWHGWQYRPQDGCSPPPFKEKIATYQVRIVSGRVQVSARALPPGTPTKPVQIPGDMP